MNFHYLISKDMLQEGLELRTRPNYGESNM